MINRTDWQRTLSMLRVIKRCITAESQVKRVNKLVDTLDLNEEYLYSRVVAMHIRKALDGDE